MANNLKDLDYEQVIRSVYDPVTNALRCVSNITSVVTGEQQVEISSDEDSVAIGNQAGTNFAAVSAAGAIRVDNTLDGGATEATQVSQLGALISIDASVDGLETLATAGNASLTSIDTKSTRAFATATNTRPTVTTTSSTILASNSNRKSALIFNQSGAVVYLKYTDAAVVGEGIRLANDEKHEIGFNNLFTGAITAIRNAGSGAIEVMEGT